MEIFLVYGVSDCPHCLRACALLMEKDIQYVVINMDFSKTYRDNICADLGWRTYPIVIKLKDGTSDLIGGFHELQDLFNGQES